MHTIFFILIFLSPPALKPWLLRTLCGAQVGRGVSIGWFTALGARHIALGDHCAIRALTVIRCGGDLSVGAYTVISSFNLVYGAGDLRVGEHSYIGPQCLLNCDEEIRIGRYSAIGARCMVYTHGSFLPYTEGYWVRFGAVRLGSYVWCAAGVFLHPGTRIDDTVFVNSRSVVSGSIPSGAVMEGNPAQQTTTIDKLRRSVSPRRLATLIDQLIAHFVEVGLGRELRVRAERRPDGLSLRYRGRAYRIVRDPIGPALETADEITIVLVTQQSAASSQRSEVSSQPQPGPDQRSRRPPDMGRLRGQSLPKATPPTLTIDLTNNTMQATRDPIYHALVEFMLRYYGIQLEYTT